MVRASKKGMSKGKGFQARQFFRPYRKGAGKGKKSQKGESSSGKAHIAEEEHQEAEEETLLTKKKKMKKMKKKKKKKIQEGFAYCVHHFDLPAATSDNSKRPKTMFRHEKRTQT